MQAGLAVLGSVIGAVAFWRTRQPLFLIGAALMLANLPFTFVAIGPINTELLGLTGEQAGAASRALIERWGGLHAVRAGLALLATAALWAGLVRAGDRPPHSALRK